MQRSHDEESANYVRGRPAKIDHNPDGDTLEVFVEDTLGHEQQRIPADLVVLSVAAAPNDGAIKLAEILGIETDRYGFIAPADAAISAVESTREGIYVCGSAVGPQVIPDCVAQASAAAARAQLYLTGHRIEEQDEPRGTDGSLRSAARRRDGLPLRREHRRRARRGGAGRATPPRSADVEVASRPLRLLVHRPGRDGGDDQRAQAEPPGGRRVHAADPRAGLPGDLRAHRLQPLPAGDGNIRDQCSWVHAETKTEAQEKARALIRMGVARARHLEPLNEGEAPMTRAALVIGGGIAGIQAATDLAVQGFPVTLVEKSDQLGGRLTEPNLKLLYPTMRPAARCSRRRSSASRRAARGCCSKPRWRTSPVSSAASRPTLKGKVDEDLPVGAMILAIGADLHEPTGEYGYGQAPT